MLVENGLIIFADPGQMFFLFPVQLIHPSDGLIITNFPQIDLCRLQILMPQNNLGDYLQRYAIPACICCRVPAQIVGSYFDIELPSQSDDQSPDSGITKRKYPGVRREILAR